MVAKTPTSEIGEVEIGNLYGEDEQQTLRGTNNFRLTMRAHIKADNIMQSKYIIHKKIDDVNKIMKRNGPAV